MVDQGITLEPIVAERKSFPLWQITALSMLVVSMFVGWHSYTTVEEMQSELAMRPRVIVVDPSRIALQAAHLKTDAETAKLNTAIVVATKRFHEAGYLVLNADAVVAASESHFLNAADLGFSAD